MNTKLNFDSIGQNVVYLKPILTADLPAEVRAEVGDLRRVFAVHNADGEQVALVANPAIATQLAAHHKMRVMPLH